MSSTALCVLQGQLQEDLCNGHSCFRNQGRWPSVSMRAPVQPPFLELIEVWECQLCKNKRNAILKDLKAASFPLARCRKRSWTKFNSAYSNWLPPSAQVCPKAKENCWNSQAASRVRERFVYDQRWCESSGTSCCAFFFLWLSIASLFLWFSLLVS